MGWKGDGWRVLFLDGEDCFRTEKYEKSLENGLLTLFMCLLQ